MTVSARERERSLMAIALSGDEQTSAKIVLAIEEEDLLLPESRWLLVELAKRIGRGHQLHDLIPYASDKQVEYLTDLHGRYVTDATAEDLVAATKADTRRRKAIIVLGEAQEKVRKGDDDAVQDALTRLADIMMPSTVRRVHNAKDVFTAGIARAEAMYSNKLRRQLPLGLSIAEEHLAIQPGQLVLLGARTSVGKTALALTWTWEIAFKGGIPVLYLNSEMNTGEMGLRLSAIGRGLHLGSLRNNPDDDQLAQLRAVREQYESAPAFVSEEIGTLTSTEVVALTHYHHALHKTEVLFVDYIQRLGDWSQSRHEVAEWQKLMEITRALKSLATRLGIVVVVLAQLNAAGDLAQSKGMANECDLVLGLERCREENSEDNRLPPKAKNCPSQTHLMWILKGRHIDPSKTFPLRMSPDTLRFSEVYPDERHDSQA